MAWGTYGWGSFYWGEDPEVMLPVPTSVRACGEGLWVGQKEGYGKDVRTLGRIRIDDPLTGNDIGPPSYQFQLVVNPAGSPDFWAILHGVTAGRFFLKELNWNEDPHDSASHSTLVTLNGATSGRALAAINHSTEGLLTIWNNAVAGALLGIDFHTGTAPVVGGATPDISGTDLGFTSAQDTDLEWIAFAAREREDGMVAVLGLLQDPTVSRTRPGETTGLQMYRFVIDPTVAPGPLAVVETIEEITTDFSFAPHQFAEGYNVPLDGKERKRLLWCAGRFDPEKLNPSVTPINGAGFCTMGAEGVWVTEDIEDLDNWTLKWSSAAGVSYTPADHVSFGGQNEQPRDIGLVFDESWQRLSFFGIDTDPSQDPVQERPIWRFV